jgi:hypothetical protein
MGRTKGKIEKSNGNGNLLAIFGGGGRSVRRRIVSDRINPTQPMQKQPYKQ